MHAAIDMGNSRTKIGLFEGTALVDTFIWKEWGIAEIQKLTTNHPIDKVILSSVVEDLPLEVEEFFAQRFFFLRLNAATPLPFSNTYQTPQTLGRDRIAAVAGALTLHPNLFCLAVDAGTCITYDLLTADAVYLGGNIAPGIGMRLRSMHEFTARLPEVDLVQEEGWVGSSTFSAMRLGAILGAAMEIDGHAALCRKHYSAPKIILTGGDAAWIVDKVNEKLDIEPNLVLIGLNKILNYNVERFK
jgi:type III pantothenate kinase